MNTPKKSWPPGSPSIPQSLLATGYGWHTWPPWALPYVIQTFWFPTPFAPLASWLLYLVPLSPHGPAQSGHAHSGRSQMSLLLAVLFHVSTVNFFLHHPLEQPCASFHFFPPIHSLFRENMLTKQLLAEMPDNLTDPFKHGAP